MGSGIEYEYNQRVTIQIVRYDRSYIILSLTRYDERITPIKKIIYTNWNLA